MAFVHDEHLKVDALELTARCVWWTLDAYTRSTTTVPRVVLSVPAHNQVPHSLFTLNPTHLLSTMSISYEVRTTSGSTLPVLSLRPPTGGVLRPPRPAGA